VNISESGRGRTGKEKERIRSQRHHQVEGGLREKANKGVYKLEVRPKSVFNLSGRRGGGH